MRPASERRGPAPLRAATSLILLFAACLAPAAQGAQTRPLAIDPLFRVNPTDAADRRVQTRRFHTEDHAEVLLASAAALQDMGFSITTSEPAFGLLVASKDAEVEGAGVGHAVAEGALVVTTLALSLLVGEDLVTDLPEQIGQAVHVSLLVSEVPAGGGTEVRVSIDRDMIYDQGYTLADHTELPTVYAEFFDRLSKSVFLEGQRL